MKQSSKQTIRDVFSLFLSSATARGCKDVTLKSYKQHFAAISKRLDVDMPIAQLTEEHLNNMICIMREEKLSPTSIQTYTRTLKVFFSFCNEKDYTDLNITIYKAPETVKETYTDEELTILLKKPSKNCNFAEYRNWVIINFLLNSGVRASTVRNIKISDVDIPHKHITLRHNKNGKIQVIPLCSIMINILKDYMNIRGGKSEDYLFCNEFGDYLTDTALRQAIVKYNTNRGVNKTSIHAFRHTFAKKYLVDCGGDAFTLQKLMGHSTLNMTKHYCNIFNNEIIDRHEQHSPLVLLTHKQKKVIF